MASPDLTPYNPLIPFDKDPQDFIQQALDARTTRFPEYNPQEGDPDLEQLASLALPAAEIVYAINRAVNGWAEIDAGLVGVVRRDGVSATTVVEFTVTPDPNGVDIPAGFLASLDLGNGETITFATDVAVVSAANATTVTAAATATTTGSDPNGVPDDTPLVPQSAHPAVSSVKTATVAGGGTDPEDDGTFLARYVARKATLTATLVNVDHFTAYALDALGAYRVLTLDNTDVTDTAIGHVTVFVAKQGGAYYTTDEKNAMAADMDARAQANLIVHVANPVIEDIDVDVTVVAQAGFDEATVTANVQAAIDAYLSPDTWPWTRKVYRNELISIIDRAAGVDRVATLAEPASDYTLTGSAPLARAGDVTVAFTP